MNQNINKIRQSESGFNTNSIQQNNQIITGYFPKDNTASDLALKRLNDTLSGLLLCIIVISTICYYFVVSSEIKLNEYSRETTLLNVENAELQNKLDRLKSFNNVDLTMQKNNLLQRPEQVIETTEVNSTTIKEEKKPKTEKTKVWSLGY
jgi:hypothetical protein